MNKKVLLLTLIALIVIFAGIAGFLYWQSFKAVHFVFKKTDTAITVYRQVGDKRTQIDSLDKDTERRMQKGRYVIIPGNTNLYSPAPIEFEVREEDMTVEINPDYSSSYRRTLRQIELPAIKEELRTTYPTLIDNFVIDDGEIYKEGQWYATLLIERAQGSDEGDVYRTVLKKENGKWIVKAKPALVLGAWDHPDIPKEILSSVNSKAPSPLAE